MQMHLAGLFRGADQVVLLSGTQDALEKLRLAVQRDRLSVDDRAPSAGVAVQDAVKHLRDLKRYPSIASLINLHAFGQQHGFTPASLQPTIPLAVANPPFAALKLENLLVVLKAASLMQNITLRSAAVGHTHWSSCVYELGVVTAIFQNGQTTRNVELFKTGTAAATDTIWIFRACLWSKDGYKERWHSICRPPFEAAPPVPNVLVVQPALPNVPPARLAPPAAMGLTRAGTQRVRNAPLRKARQLDVDNMTADDILACDPDDIVQEAVLKVAESYRNIDILQIINRNLVALGRPEIDKVNNIARRIAVAHETASRNAAKHSKKPAATIYKEMVAALNQTRRANGVKTRKPSSQQQRGDDGDEYDDEELVDIEGEKEEGEAAEDDAEEIDESAESIRRDYNLRRATKSNFDDKRAAVAATAEHTEYVLDDLVNSDEEMGGGDEQEDDEDPDFDPEL